MAVIPRKDIKSIRTADGPVIIFQINQNTDTKQTADVKLAASASPRALTDKEIRNVVCRLKDRFPHLKLIVLRALDESIAVEEVMGAGAEGLVLKRSTATDLISAVEEVFQGRTYISASVNEKAPT
jgi:DNA-binding NarL/FixJ family response regulator